MQRGISVLAKSISPARLRENFAAAAPELAPCDLERIAALDQNCRIVATNFWLLDGGPWTHQTIWDEA